MKLFHVSWNYPETAFHEMAWKKNFAVYPFLKKLWGNVKHVHRTQAMKQLIKENNFRFSINIYKVKLDLLIDSYLNCQDQGEKYWNYICFLISNICCLIPPINISDSSIFFNLKLANKRRVCSSLPLYNMHKFCGIFKYSI